MPLGVVLGRWLWVRLANGFGTLAEPAVPLPGIATLVVVVLALAAISGLVPIRAGLRHQPATVLHGE